MSESIVIPENGLTITRVFAVTTIVRASTVPPEEGPVVGRLELTVSKQQDEAPLSRKGIGSEVEVVVEPGTYDITARQVVAGDYLLEIEE